MRQVLERLVEERGTAMARSLPGSARAVTNLIVGTRRLGLSVYWWEVQNMVMALPDRGVHVELCQLLNVSAPEA